MNDKDMEQLNTEETELHLETESLLNQVDSYMAVAHNVHQNGICRDDVVSMESSFEVTVITDQVPVQGFSRHRSPMNQEIAMESIIGRARDLLGRAMDKVIAFMKRIISRLMGTEVPELKDGAVRDLKTDEGKAAWVKQFPKELNVWLEGLPKWEVYTKESLISLKNFADLHNRLSEDIKAVVKPLGKIAIDDDLEKMQTFMDKEYKNLFNTVNEVFAFDGLYIGIFPDVVRAKKEIAFNPSETPRPTWVGYLEDTQEHLRKLASTERKDEGKRLTPETMRKLPSPDDHNDFHESVGKIVKMLDKSSRELEKANDSYKAVSKYSAGRKSLAATGKKDDLIIRTEYNDVLSLMYKATLLSSTMSTAFNRHYNVMYKILSVGSKMRHAVSL